MRKLLVYPFIGLIYIYKWAISPYLGVNKCRFQPSCSTYAIGVLKKYGIFKGGFLAAKRILSCHPWGKSGYDPIP